MTSKKNQDQKFLLLLLRHLEQEISISNIAKATGKSKQALNYHIRKAEKLKIIEKICSFPYAKYRITALGNSVKKSLIQPQGTSLLFRIHNGIIGFQILSFGEFKFITTRDRKIIQMTNWKYARESKGDYIINIQETGLLKIYIPEVLSTNYDESIGQQTAECQRIAQSYADKFNMRFGNLRLIRNFHKELQKSQALAKVIGKYKSEALYVDASNGEENIEEQGNSQAIEQLLDLPRVLNRELIPAIREQAQSNKELAENIKLHLNVLTDMKETLKDIRADLKQRQVRELSAEPSIPTKSKPAEAPRVPLCDYCGRPLNICICDA